jgi:hypothetical protein
MINHSVLTTMLSIAGTEVKTVKYCEKGKAGCFAVADFWKEIGSMSKTDVLVQLEKFFYQGLEHKGVQLHHNVVHCWH